MATILDQHATGDGYDVRILTAGEAYTLHFVVQPNATELSDAVETFEKRLIDDVVAKHHLEEI